MIGSERRTSVPMRLSTSTVPHARRRTRSGSRQAIQTRLLIALGLLAGVPLGAEPLANSRFQGVVQDKDGKPVQADVLLVDSSKPTNGVMSAKVLAQTATGPDGKFELQSPVLARPTPLLRVTRYLLARSGSRVAISFLSDPYASEQTDLKLVLEAERRLNLELRKDDGKSPLPGVTIDPVEATVKHRGVTRTIRLPANIATDAQAVSDDKGVAMLPLQWSETVEEVRVQVRGYSLSASLRHFGTTRVDVPRLGAMIGKIEGINDPKVLERLRVLAVSADEVGEDQMLYDGEAIRLRVDASGTFRWGGVEPGKYRAFLCSEPQSGFEGYNILASDIPYVASPLPSVEIKAYEFRDDVKFSVETPGVVTGQVIDDQTGKGLGKVCLLVKSRRSETEDWVEHDQRGVITDATGQFTCHVRPGLLEVRAVRVPDGFVLSSSPLPLGAPSVELRDSLKLEPIRIRKVGDLKIIVVDDEGKPVAGARVETQESDYSMPTSDLGSITNADGEFVLKKVNPETDLGIRVRAKEAVNGDLQVIQPKSQGDPVRITISPKHAVKLKGIVRRSDGSPLSGAVVKLHHEKRMEYSAGYSTWMDGTQILRTKEDGTFKTNALWSFDRYMIEVSASQCATFKAHAVPIKAGEEFDFGVIALPTLTTLTGRVVDESGQSVQQVAVIAPFDGIDGGRSMTDTQGRFTLKSIFPGDVLLIAAKEGIPRGVWEGSVSSNDITMVLSRESIMSWPRELGPTHELEAKRLEVARWLVRGICEVLDRTGRTPDERLLGVLARFDASEAMERTLQLDEYLRPQMMRTIAIETARSDREGARQMILSLAKAESSNASLRVARMLQTFDQKASDEFLSLAITQANTCSGMERAGTLAEVANYLWEIGESAGGAHLALLAGELADKHSSRTPRNQQYRQHYEAVVEALAPIAPDRARKLLRSLPDNGWKDQREERLLIQLEVTKPSKENDWEPNNDYLHVVRGKLADRAAAAQAALAIEDRATRFVALNWLIYQLRDQDQQLSELLMNEAFRTMEAKARRSTRIVYGQTEFDTGAVALTSYLTKNPRMREIVLRAAIARTTDTRTLDEEEKQSSLRKRALLFGYLDPRLGERLSERFRSRGFSFEPSYHRKPISDIDVITLLGPESAKPFLERSLRLMEVEQVDPDWMQSRLTILADLMSRHSIELGRVLLESLVDDWPVPDQIGEWYE